MLQKECKSFFLETSNIEWTQFDPKGHRRVNITQLGCWCCGSRWRVNTVLAPGTREVNLLISLLASWLIYITVSIHVHCALSNKTKVTFIKAEARRTFWIKSWMSLFCSSERGDLFIRSGGLLSGHWAACSWRSLKTIKLSGQKLRLNFT